MTTQEASIAYAKMLYPAMEGLNYESAKQDFKLGIEWEQARQRLHNETIAKTLKSIIEVAQATLKLIESGQQ
jgi:hypothetical protein